jgi:hypothetical protein
MLNHAQGGQTLAGLALPDLSEFHSLQISSLEAPVCNIHSVHRLIYAQGDQVLAGLAGLLIEFQLMSSLEAPEACVYDDSCTGGQALAGFAVSSCSSPLAKNEFEHMF